MALNVSGVRQSARLRQQSVVWDENENLQPQVINERLHSESCCNCRRIPPYDMLSAHFQLCPYKLTLVNVDLNVLNPNPATGWRKKYCYVDWRGIPQMKEVAEKYYYVGLVIYMHHHLLVSRTFPPSGWHIFGVL
jgi:hypothetical protein